MTLLISEMKRGMKALLIWSLCVGGMLFVCMLMFPQMRPQMDGIGEMFSSMGGFSEAFGMDRINFGTIMGFYGVEGGNMLGIGGGFFAAFLGVRALSREENEHTVEFLFTHPISRTRVVSEKLLTVFAQLLLFNIIIIALSLLSFPIIGETCDLTVFFLFHLAHLSLQLEIAGLCFLLSAFARRASIGAGFGLAALLYFLNVLANISKDAAFLKYITPFSYAEAADILTNHALDAPLLFLGLAYAAIAVAAAYAVYLRKDLSA